MAKQNTINLQVKIEGVYADTFKMFQDNNPDDGVTNTSTIKAILRELPEYEVSRKRLAPKGKK